MGEKMKIRDQLKIKNKLKVTSNFKVLNYARYLSIIVPCLALFMLFLQSGFSTSNIQQIITEDPLITTTFIICLVNLLVYYQMGNLLKFLHELKHIETVRMQLIIIAFAN